MPMHSESSPTSLKEDGKEVRDDLLHTGVHRKIPFSSQLAGKKSKFGFFLSEEADYQK